MICIQSAGRLGNRLFQYANGRSLALMHNTDLMIEFGTNEPLYLNHFDVILRPFPRRNRLIDHILTGIRTKIPRTNDTINRMLALYPLLFAGGWRLIGRRIPYATRVKDVYTIKDNTYLEGVLLGYDPIINEYEEIIRKELTFKTSTLSKKSLSVLTDIHSSPQSIGIHIRRGDFLNTPNVVVGLSYYEYAFKMLTDKISQSVHVYVFSNDIPWAREHLPKIIDKRLLYFVDHNNEETCVEDLYLLSQCKHQILSRGTFSWWGAFLNPYPHKLIVMPSDQYHESYHAKHGDHLLYIDA